MRKIILGILLGLVASSGCATTDPPTVTSPVKEVEKRVSQPSKYEEKKINDSGMIRKDSARDGYLNGVERKAPLAALPAAEPLSIGLILPLSGKFAAFGNRALQGAELAIERHNTTDAGKRSPLMLLIKDSQGLPEVAERAVKELDAEGVDVIIGPILGFTADSAGRMAQHLGIPIITMAQKEGITDIGDWVFRNCITNAAQVRGLVKHAAAEGIKRVAVLYPDNAYGRELSTVFKAEMEKSGGEVVAIRSYKDGQTDFGQEIKGMVGPDFLKKMKEYSEGVEKRFKEAEKAGKDKDKDKDKIKDKEQKSDLIKPMPDFDAVFIADYSERVGLIVPQLAFFDVTGVKLLGISGWNSPNLLKLAKGYLDNAMFVDGFFSGSQRPNVTEFVETYRKIFGEEPTILEAQAFDTAGMVLSVAAEGVSSRDEIRKGILKIRDYQGVCGKMSFAGRDAERDVYLLTVRNERIDEISVP